MDLGIPLHESAAPLRNILTLKYLHHGRWLGWLQTEDGSG